MVLWSDYPLVEKPGVTVILINDKKVLLLRRINIPFITHPGIWYVVAGSRKARRNARRYGL